MELTDKAKEDFFKKCKYIETIFNELPEIYKNALIVEWLDSVGIYIETLKEPIDYMFKIHRGNYKNTHFNCGGFKTRSEATKQAIIKYNEIYNSIQ